MKEESKLRKILENFNINIGFSDVQYLVRNNYDLNDVFNLSKKNLEGLGYTSLASQKIVDEIKKTQHKEYCLYEILSKLNIKGLGKNNSKKIFEYYSLYDLLNSKNLNLLLKEILKPYAIKNFQKQLDDENSYFLILIKNLNVIDNVSLHESEAKGNEIFEHIDYSDEKNKTIKKPTKPVVSLIGIVRGGKSFYKRYFENKGYSVEYRVTNKTNFVLFDGRNSSNISKARRMNIPLYTYNDFFN